MGLFVDKGSGSGSCIFPDPDPSDPKRPDPDPQHRCKGLSSNEVDMTLSLKFFSFFLVIKV